MVYSNKKTLADTEKEEIVEEVENIESIEPQGCHSLSRGLPALIFSSTTSFCYLFRRRAPRSD